MADYLIQGSTLDAIANEIHAKNSSAPYPMTPTEMIIAIDGIQTGGGTTPTFHKISEYTITEAVNSVLIPIPDAMKRRGGFHIKLIDVTFNDPFLYFGVGTRSASYFASSTISTAVDGVYTFNQVFSASWCVQDDISANETAPGVQSYSKLSTAADTKVSVLSNTIANTIGLYPYTQTHQFLSGTIEIWGWS